MAWSNNECDPSPGRSYNARAMKRNDIAECLGRGLYAMADMDALQAKGLTLKVGLRALIDTGAPVVQLRWKNAAAGPLLEAARAFVDICRQSSVTSIVNDRVDIAAAAGADGVHLGQDDLPVEEARRILPKGSIIGLSTHDLAQVEEALDLGADYIGFGPVFPTSTKKNPDPVVGLEGLAEAARLVDRRLPIVAIGGIELAGAGEVARAGADLAAVVSDIIGAEEPAARGRSVHRMILEAGRR